jgi:hypothetical protein
MSSKFEPSGLFRVVARVLLHGGRGSFALLQKCSCIAMKALSQKILAETVSRNNFSSIRKNVNGVKINTLGKWQGNAVFSSESACNDFESPF